MFRRLPEIDLVPAHEALAEGRYEAAFSFLEGAAKRQRGKALQARYWLHLASFYALYGADGLENGVPTLKMAVAADPNLVEEPLYLALFWAFDAYRGAATSDVKRGLRTVVTDDAPEAAYHAAAALQAVGSPKGALRRLQSLDEAILPTYLQWRRWSMLGQAHEALGAWSDAADAYLNAVAQAPANEREPERLAYASCLLEMGRAAEVLEVLQEVDPDGMEDGDRAMACYVEGRAHLEVGNPNRALELLLHARAIDPDPDASFSLVYATGQTLLALQRFEAAVATLQEAIEIAPTDHRAYAQHEAAVALLESDGFDAAQALLEEVVADPQYPHRGEALADLAEVRMRAGDFDQAKADAEQALEMGATAPACLVLGALAYEYFHLDEAVRYYEQAVAASQVGDPSWLSAQQMLADVHAQRGEPAADQVLRHALAALEHTEVGSEWRLPLERHVLWARGLLGGHDRVLN